jgi:hypothetical protein
MKWIYILKKSQDRLVVALYFLINVKYRVKDLVLGFGVRSSSLRVAGDVTNKLSLFD